MKKLILFLMGMSPLFAFSKPGFPADHVVSFDEVLIAEDQIVYERNSKDLRPRLSEFQVSYRRFLSNDVGERFALVTFTKETGILRIVDEQDIVGILANGERLYPISIDGETRIGSRGTALLNFGPNKFPLVGVETRNE